MAMALERLEDGTADDATRMQLQGGVYKTDHSTFKFELAEGGQQNEAAAGAGAAGAGAAGAGANLGQGQGETETGGLLGKVRVGAIPGPALGLLFELGPSFSPL
jgi:hypothetical protein